jgi:hypothetical protein
VGVRRRAFLARLMVVGASSAGLVLLVLVVNGIFVGAFGPGDSPPAGLIDNGPALNAPVSVLMVDTPTGPETFTYTLAQDPHAQVPPRPMDGRLPK